MTKWIPYVLAAIVGIGVAIVAFGPGLGGSGKASHGAASAGPKATTTTTATSSADGAAGEGGEATADAPDAPPDPASFRPQNKAEIEHSARLARPVNRHIDYTSSWWQRAGQLVGKTHPELAAEVSKMVMYLRDQSKLGDDALDQPALIAKEQDLIARIKAAGVQSSELDGILKYLQESSQAVLDGKDPTLVVKPAHP